MQCQSFACLTRIIAAGAEPCLLYGNVEQERELRLLLCLRLAVHGFESRRTRHDFHHRARERHCESFLFFFFGDPVARGLRLRPPWDVRVVESDLLRLLLEEREKIGTKNG